MPGLAYRPQLMNAVQKMAEGHLAKQVPDEALRAKLTPDYVIGCKRILPSNKWYPAIVQPNVEVVTSGVDVVHSDGRGRRRWERPRGRHGDLRHRLPRHRDRVLDA